MKKIKFKWIAFSIQENPYKVHISIYGMIPLHQISNDKKMTLFQYSWKIICKMLIYSIQQIFTDDLLFTKHCANVNTCEHITHVNRPHISYSIVSENNVHSLILSYVSTYTKTYINKKGILLLWSNHYLIPS